MERRRLLLLLANLPAWPAVSKAASAVETTVETEAMSAPPVAFAPVLPGRKLSFPADHGAHPEFRTEWWYATGWLSLPDGSPLGFQLTFFRVRTGIAEARMGNSASAFAPRQLILAHAAIADPSLGYLRHEERAARVGFGRAGFDTQRTHIWTGDWHLEQQSDVYLATINGKDFSYALTLVPNGPALPNGLDGYSQKAPDSRNASYYYSRPQLAVSGGVTLAGRLQKVTGHAWLDHEWSSELLPAAAQGWDWVGLNLDDGSTVMAFRLRDQAGLPLWSSGTLRAANGSARSLKPDQVAFEPQRTWQSQRTGIRYPVAWTLRIGPRIFHLNALMDDQELDSRRSTGTLYWEGAVRVTEDQREIGRGYLELTGYGERIRIG